MRILSLLLGMFSGAAGVFSLSTDAFRLNVPGDWIRKPGDDPSQYVLVSKSLGVQVTLSWEAANIGAKTERTAQAFKGMRMEAEGQAAAEHGLHLTIAEPIVAPYAGGHQLAYFGHDDRGRQFRFLGLVCAKGVLSVYAESSQLAVDRLQSVFDQILKGLTSERLSLGK
jgi:hypothetical protein